jgi:hypothetical protein
MWNVMTEFFSQAQKQQESDLEAAKSRYKENFIHTHDQSDGIPGLCSLLLTATILLQVIFSFSMTHKRPFCLPLAGL